MLKINHKSKAQEVMDEIRKINPETKMKKYLCVREIEYHKIFKTNGYHSTYCPVHDCIYLVTDHPKKQECPHCTSEKGE